MQTTARNVQKVALFLWEYVSRNKTKSLLIGLSGWLTYQFIHKQLKRKYLQYPPGPIGLPFIGSVSSLWNINYMNQLPIKYGDIVMYNFFGLTNILISDAKIAKQIICRKDVLDRFFVKGVADVFSVGKTEALLSLNGDKWARRRRLIQNTMIRSLSDQSITEILQKPLNQTLMSLLDKLSEDDDNKAQWTNIDEVMHFLTFSTLFASIFGISFNSMQDPKYKEVSQIVDDHGKYFLFYFLCNRMCFIKYIFATKYSAMNKFFEKRNGLFEQFVRERRKLQNACANNSCMIDHFNVLIDEKQMTMYECVADVNMLLFAGSDTTSSSLGFGVFLIAKYPNIITKIRQQMICVLGENNHKMDLRQLNNCPLLRALVYEILRISSVASTGVGHSCMHDFCVEDNNGNEYRIPAKSFIKYNVEYIHHFDHSWIGNGNELCLENWLDDNEYFKMNELFISFGAGRRDCIGRNIAVKEIAMIMGCIILNYDLEFVDENPKAEIIKVGGSLRRIKPVPIKVRKI